MTTCSSIFPPSADAPHDGPGWSAPLRCVLSPHEHDRHLNGGIYWGGGMPEASITGAMRAYEFDTSNLTRVERVRMALNVLFGWPFVLLGYDASQTSTAVDDLPADRASELSAQPSSEGSGRG